MPIIYKLQLSERPRALRSRTLLVIAAISVLVFAFLFAVISQARIGFSELLQLSILSALFSTVGSTLLSFALVTALFVFGVRESVKSIWKSFEVELGDDYVARRQVRSPEIRIGRDEVTYLQEDSSGLAVHTNTKNKLIGIPRTLDGYDAVKSVLISWAPTRPPLLDSRTRTIAVSILVLVAMAIVMFSIDVWLLLIANIVLLGYSGFTYLQMRGNDGVDPQIKRSMLIIAGWVLFFDLTKICFHLSFAMPVK